MQLSDKQLQQKADYLLTVFEMYHFENKLSYSYNLNLVLEFCDHINQLPDWQLLAELESENIEDAKKFRNIINSGIDNWLKNRLKTICL